MIHTCIHADIHADICAHIKADINLTFTINPRKQSPQELAYQTNLMMLHTMEHGEKKNTKPKTKTEIFPDSKVFVRHQI